MTMTIRSMAAILLLWAAVPAAAEPAHFTPASDVTQQWAGFYNAKNLDALMTLYAPDPMFLPVSGGRWEGLGEIRRHFLEELAAYDPRLVMRSVRSDVSGNLAYDSGTYTESMAPVKGGGEIRARGNYLIVYRRKSRGAPWRILEQSWTRGAASAP
jgi:ketosteroid isomerase-like protein